MAKDHEAPATEPNPAAAEKPPKKAKKATKARKTAKKATKAKSPAGRTTSPRKRTSAAGNGGSSAAGKNLVIVESPAKARTIERYLGSAFQVMPSIGHVIDLPKSKMAVDIENDFQPEYTVIKGKKSILDQIKRRAREANAVYLAPDPDREGEAIAYHIAESIRDVNSQVYRATFNEITRTAVNQAINSPTQIDLNLFNAQQARRVLDRLVGYNLSPLLWRKVRRGLSAGRVQSVAVRLICDREAEIEAFKAEKYWTVEALAHAAAPPPFKIALQRIDDRKAEIKTLELAEQCVAETQDQPFVVSDVVKKEVAKRPFAPFITSTLQQEASRKMRLTARHTMGLAQRLYEGVELGKMGSVGLITYMRTDSTRLSDDALRGVRKHIDERYGPDYLPEKSRIYTGKKGAQDAHEAIRPTDFALSPDVVAPYLKREKEGERLLALYTLIWKRTVASQMVDARLERTRVEIPVGRYLFVATGSIVKFDGYLRIYQEAQDESGKTESDMEGSEPVRLGTDDDQLPPLEKGDKLEIEDLKHIEHETQPPPRFTEAGLIRELERQGIGRPSTYAAIISTIQDKDYANKEGGTFRPTELGKTITELLIESFPHIMDVKFTAMMEDQLDNVEDGSVNWVDLVRNFYGPFSQKLEEAASKMRNVKAEVVPTDIECDKCGSQMVVRWGRNGKFLACSAFPKCRNTKPVAEDEEGNVKVAEQETTDRKCPTCGSDMAVRNGRLGRFLACTAYPECKATLPYPIGVPCGREGCDGELVERRSGRGRTFYSCSNYPECRYSVSERPYKDECEHCGQARHFIGQGARKKVLCCNEKDKECAYVVVKERPAKAAAGADDE